jgi:hypothetical protein
LNQLLLGEDVDPRKLSSDEQAILRETNKLDQQTLQILLRANRVIEKKLPAGAVADYDPELDDDLISVIDISLAGEKTIPDSGIGEPTAAEPAVDDADREQEAKYLLKSGKIVYENLLGKSDTQFIKNYLDSRVFKHDSTTTNIKIYDKLTNKDILIDYLVYNRIPIDGRKNPWNTINNNIDADFIDGVRIRQGLAGKGLTGVAAPLSSYIGKCVGNPKCPCRSSSSSSSSNRSSSRGGCFISNRTTGGSIIQFWSSNHEELIKKLNTMLAEFQAGNNNVLNHISAIVDELRRQGILSINEIMKLYNSLK